MARLLTVDASVAVKWLVQEEGTDQAEALAALPTRFIAPDILFAEVSNALWRQVRHGTLLAEQAYAACDRLPRFLEETASSRELMPRAIRIAVELQHPTYDCFYIACAEKHDAPLVSADKRLLFVAEQAGYGALVTPLHA